MTRYIVKSEIFNLDYEMETLNFISNGEDLCPVYQALHQPLGKLEMGNTYQNEEGKSLREIEK
jgi:hypothetical protein